MALQVSDIGRNLHFDDCASLSNDNRRQVLHFQVVAPASPVSRSWLYNAAQDESSSLLGYVGLHMSQGSVHLLPEVAACKDSAALSQTYPCIAVRQRPDEVLQLYNMLRDNVQPTSAFTRYPNMRIKSQTRRTGIDSMSVAVSASWLPFDYPAW